MMAFNTLDSDSIAAPVPEMQLDSATGARRWDAEVETGSLEVEVFPTGCVDDMSGEVFNYMVHVAHKNKSYSGCGNFINTTYKLNDFWQLHAINGSEIMPQEEENAQEIPSLHFDVAENKVSGSTGCNRLNGSFTLKDNRLLFSKEMATTRRACQGDMESRFLSALQKVARYEITNAELSLIGESDTLMVFRREE
jgi:heat shock protein HslJ